MQHPNFAFCKVVILAGLAFCDSGNLARAQSRNGPDLAIESLTLDDEIGAGRTLRYRCVIRNRGNRPVPANRNVALNAFLSADRQAGPEARRAGVAVAKSCAGLEPGKTCSATGLATYDKGYRFLVVTVSLGGSTKDADSTNATAAVALDHLTATSTPTTENAPNVAITSLSLVRRSETGLVYRCTIRNLADDPVASRDVKVEAHLSANRSLDNARRTGGRYIFRCGMLQPGGTCSGKFPAPLPNGDFRFLVVKVNPQKRGNPPDADFSDNVSAIGLDAPLKPQPETPQVPRTQPEVSTTAVTEDHDEETSERSKGRTSNRIFILFPLILGLMGLGLFALYRFFLAGSRRAGQSFPLRFRQISPDDLPGEADWGEVAQRIGFQLVKHVPVRLQMTAESALGGDDCQLTAVMQRKVRDGSFTLCNYRLEKQYTSRIKDSTRTWTEVRHHTVLIFTADHEVYFPPFSVSPNWHSNSFFLKLYGNRWFGRIRFDDDPEFHQRLLLGTVVPEAVEPLLTGQVRESLKENADLTTFVSGRSIVISTPAISHETGRSPGGFRLTLASKPVVVSGLVHPAEWPRFLRATAKLVNVIRKSEKETRAERPSPSEIAIQASVHRQGPGYGFLPREEVDRLLRDKPPRRLSKSLRQATRSKLAPWLRLCGWIFLLIPGSLLALVWSPGFPEGRLFPTILTSLGLALGLLLVVIPTWKRLRILSLLKRGKCVSAEVTHLRRSNTSIIVDRANYRRYHASFAYSLDGESYQVQANTYGDQTRRAAVLEENREPTRILVSPSNPTRLFWIDGLILE